MQTVDDICDKLDTLSTDHSDILRTLLEAYGFSKTTIKRALDLDTSQREVTVIKQKLVYKEVAKGADLEKEIMELPAHCVKNERFLVVTDGERIIAKDTKYSRYLDRKVSELSEDFEFFMPWLGKERTEEEVENPADVKAAREMGKLYSAIMKDNEGKEKLSERAINVFLTRILFCFFADDTNIFHKNQFIDSVRQNTQDDGSDLAKYLDALFDTLDIPDNKRASIKPCYKAFPYVNGSLFGEKLPIPSFTKESRKKLIECGMNDWSGISPDIFGSMFQTVVSPGQRRNLGQHYTSVSNIMKVLKPLFLDELWEELDEIKKLNKDENRDKKLTNFRNKLSRIKVFDPACGSGNFCIVAYKELCELEMETFGLYFVPELPFLSIKLNHFCGIEVDDFPVEIARLALWLAQHQVNIECYEKFGNCNPTLPLTASGNFVCGNALTTPWEEVCPCDDESIVYIASNPPFCGKDLSAVQNADRARLLDGCMNPGIVDYVGCWFVLAARYIKKHSNVKAAFVSTNSIYQGMQVGLWPFIKEEGVEPYFAYEDFKWKNNAQNNAGVIVTITGLCHISKVSKRYIYSETARNEISNIGPYKSEAEVVVVSKSKPLGNVPIMDYGTKFADGGNLILSTMEKNELIRNNSDSEKYVRLCLGADDFLNEKQRWCLWLDDSQLAEAEAIPFINDRLQKCKEFRENSKSSGDAYKLRNRYWQSREHRDLSSSCIIVPRVSSENREFVPMEYKAAGTVVLDSAFAIYDAPLWLFAILTSRIHMTWMRTVCGRLESRYRYSNTLCYNTFPFPELTEKQITALEDSADTIRKFRSLSLDLTLAQLYDPYKMPNDLRKAHTDNDQLVDSLFKKSGFKDDNERLAELFKRYKALTEDR